MTEKQISEYVGHDGDVIEVSLDRACVYIVMKKSTYMTDIIDVGYVPTHDHDVISAHTKKESAHKVACELNLRVTNEDECETHTYFVRKLSLDG